MGILNLVYNEEFKTKNGNTKIILMYAPGYLEEIRETLYLLYSDGTFKCCPDPFEQFYTVLARVENQTIPILYAFLPSNFYGGVQNVQGNGFRQKNIP